MNPQIKKVIHYIEKHLDEELDLFHLANIAGYSPFHFSRIFKVNTGETVISYVKRLKLQKAATIICIGNNTMLDVALHVGFDTPTGFLKAFKKQFGMPPSEFKKYSLIKFKTLKEIDMNTPEIIIREIAYVFSSKFLWF